MKKKWLKCIKWVILTPIILFITLMILLYIPVIQNIVCKQAVKYASQATGMDINIGRIDLRFPINLLVSDIDIKEKSDTILAVKSLNIKVQAIPLIKGRIELDNFTVKNLKVNTDTLIDGLNISGELEKIYIQSHGINLSTKEIIINTLQLDDAQIKLLNTESKKIESPDTSTSQASWNINLISLDLNKVSFTMQTPKDSTDLHTYVDKLNLLGLNIDLQNQLYKLNQLKINNTEFSYNKLIDVNKINIEIDSVLYHNNNIQATIKECSMYEKNGIDITSLTAKIHADSSQINIPSIQLLTPFSSININGEGDWAFVNKPETGNIRSEERRVGKECRL